MTKWHLKNHNCKQILLGCSHDSGYAPYLHNILRDEETKRRISILEGFSTHRLLVETGINIINYPELFRSDKLVETSFGNGGFQQRPPASNDFHNGFQQKSVSNGDIGLQPLPAPSVASPTVGQSPAPAPAPAPSMTPVPVPVAAPAVSYAARVVKSASPPPKMTLPLAPKPKATPQADQKPAWNPGPRGFDAPIKVSEKVMNEIKKRKDNNKLCNNHYLRGPCAKGPDCCFEHKYKPSPEEINAIAMLARLNPCTNGQDCDVDNCIYGHHVSHVLLGSEYFEVMLTGSSARVWSRDNANTLTASLRNRITHPERHTGRHPKVTITTNFDPPAVVGICKLRRGKFDNRRLLHEGSDGPRQP